MKNKNNTVWLIGLLFILAEILAFGLPKLKAYLDEKETESEKTTDKNDKENE